MVSHGIVCQQQEFLLQFTLSPFFLLLHGHSFFSLVVVAIIENIIIYVAIAITRSVKERCVCMCFALVFTISTGNPLVACHHQPKIKSVLKAQW